MSPTSRQIASQLSPLDSPWHGAGCRQPALSIVHHVHYTMKRSRRRLPIPQHEFGFAPHTFNLFQETALDGERIARLREQAEQARRTAEAAQPSFDHLAAIQPQ